jgi:hypothetical protein
MDKVRVAIRPQCKKKDAKMKCRTAGGTGPISRVRTKGRIYFVAWRSRI